MIRIQIPELTNMKQRITEILEEALPLVDVQSERLWDELDSLGVTQILMLLSEEYGVDLTPRDATPRNLRNLDSLVALVERKLAEKQ